MLPLETTLLAPVEGDAPLIHFWESDAVVFNVRSAETHLLSLLAATVLQSILAGPVNITALRREVIQADAQSMSPEELDDYLGQTIRELQALDLVRVFEDRSS